MSFDQWGVLALNGAAAGHAWLGALARILASYGPEVFAVILLAVWFVRPGVADRSRKAVVMAVTAAVLALIVNAVLGHVWDRARPFYAEPGAVRALVHHPDDSSFPSDHAAGSFALAWGMMAAGAAYGWLLLLAALIALARVAVGVHWPTDVIVGGAVGIGSAWAVRTYAASWLLPLYRLALRITFQRSTP